MNDALSLLATARNHLAEARRYANTQPNAAEQEALKAIRAFQSIAHELSRSNCQILTRTEHNLYVGIGCLHAAPSVLDGFCTAALWELLVMAARLEKAAQPKEEIARV